MTTLALKAESAIEADGKVTVPVTDKPAPAVKRPLVVIVLLVKVLVPDKVTTLVLNAESAIEVEGNVTVPVTDKPAPAVKRPLVVMVLFVNDSVPSKVANVPVVVGNVMVPELIILLIVGVVMVLLDND